MSVTTPRMFTVSLERSMIEERRQEESFYIGEEKRLHRPRHRGIVSGSSPGKYVFVACKLG